MEQTGAVNLVKIKPSQIVAFYANIDSKQIRNFVTNPDISAAERIEVWLKVDGEDFKMTAEELKRKLKA